MPASISSPGPGVSCGLTTNCGYIGMGPYWDNLSGDGPQMNVGYFLTGSGGFSGDTDYDPLGYLSQNNGVGSPDQPTNISLSHAPTSPLVTVLGSFTKDTTDVIGYYNASATTAAAAALTEIPLFGPGALSAGANASLSDLSNGENYGFYITKNCYSYCPAGDTSGQITWFSNDSLNTSDAGEEQFAIFDSSTSGIFYLGVEDWGLSGGTGLEANGDYNDIIFELDTNIPGGGGQTTLPEPASISLMGAGLLGLGLSRFRNRANRTSN
jgi:hypothetical protein